MTDRPTRETNIAAVREYLISLSDPSFEVWKNNCNSVYNSRRTSLNSVGTSPDQRSFATEEMKFDHVSMTHSRHQRGLYAKVR